MFLSCTQQIRMAVHMRPAGHMFETPDLNNKYFTFIYTLVERLKKEKTWKLRLHICRLEAEQVLPYNSFSQPEERACHWGYVRCFEGSSI